MRVKLRRDQTFDFSYTGLRGAQNALAGAFSKYTFNYPNHQGVAGWQGQLYREWHARIRIGAVQRFARGPYAVADLYAGRTTGRIRPFAQAMNFNGERYQEVPGVRMPGRAVLAGVEFLLRGR